MKSFLHPLFLIVLLLSLPGQVRGQRLCGYLPHSHIYELSAHEAARYSNVAYCFNRTFIKSDIGLPPDSLWKYQHDESTYSRGRRGGVPTLSWSPVSAPRGMPFVFNGKSYDRFDSYNSVVWKPRFVSLPEIKLRSLAKYVDDHRVYVFFDDVFLPDDLESYRFDEDYIDSIAFYRGRKHWDRGGGKPQDWFTYEPLRDTCRADGEELDDDIFILRVFSGQYAKEHARGAQDSLHPALPRMRTQFEEDANRSAIFLNGTFVGSTFGLNLDSLTRIGGKNPYRVTVTPEPYEAGGVRYASRTDIECKHYRPKLVPLRSLGEKFQGISYWSHPDLAICIVDNMLVSNPQNVLVDKDYISVIRGFRWDEIECLPPPEIYGRRYTCNTVGLIQVYVKKAEYLHDLAHPRII